MRPLAWGVIGLGVGLLAGGAGTWHPTLTRTEPHGHRTPSGPEWRAEHQPRQWPATAAGRRDFVRYLAILLVRLGLLAATPALLFVAHVARETRFGRAVWNNAWGNVKAHGAHPWHRLPDHEPYRSFLTPAAGAMFAVHFVREHYPRAWAKLVAGDPSWYSQLGRDGYYEAPVDPATGTRGPHTPETLAAAQREYDAVYADVRRYAA